MGFYRTFSCGSLYLEIGKAKLWHEADIQWLGIFSMDLNKVQASPL